MRTQITLKNDHYNDNLSNVDETSLSFNNLKIGVSQSTSQNPFTAQRKICSNSML